MKTTIKGVKVIYAASGDKYYPLNLFIDDLFIDKFERFVDAEKEADRIINKIMNNKEETS